MSANTETVAPREREAFDQKQLKVVWHDPQYLLAAINPRSLEELDWEVLLPKVEEEQGVITTPLTVWKLEPDDPLWDTLELRDTMTGLRIPAPPVEERAKFRIIIQGHRRERCAGEIKAHPGRFSKTVSENASKLPCIELSGITEQRARDLALDDEAKKTLKSWETVKLVLEKLARDERYQDISLEMPQLLYRALLNKGADKYDEVARIHDGNERNAKIISDLRNKLDTWIRTCYLIGPALAEMLILYYRYKVNKRPDQGDMHKLILDLKYENCSKLRKVYNSEKNAEYVPVTRIEKVLDKPEEGPNRAIHHIGQDGFFLVEGGSEVMRNEIMKRLVALREGTKPEERVTLPTKSERQDFEIQSRSGPGKSYARTFNGKEGVVDGKTRAEWDTWALAYQEKEGRLAQIKEELHPDLQMVVDVIVNERNLDKVEAAFRVINSHLVAAEKAVKVAEEAAKAAEAKSGKPMRAKATK